MKNFAQLTIAFGLLLAVTACSSSQTTENGETTDELAPVADAATDAVPVEGAEVATSSEGADLAALAGDVPAEDAAAVPPATDAPPAAAAAAAPPVVAQAEPAAVEPSPAGNGQFQDYTVQAGDTLMKIAFETYGDLYRWKSILEANRDKVTNPGAIPAGTVLKLEAPFTQVAIEKNGERYMIKNGDTLGTISGDVYGTRAKWRKLWENNKQMIHDPNRIFAGFYLYYQPEAGVPQESAPAPMAATPADAAPKAKSVATAAGLQAAERAPAAVQPVQAMPAIDPAPGLDEAPVAEPAQ